MKCPENADMCIKWGQFKNHAGQVRIPDKQVDPRPLKGGESKMKEMFKDIVNMEGVNGVILVSYEGAVLFESYSATLTLPSGRRDWLGLVSALSGIREADIVFEGARIYARRSEIGYLLVLMSSFVSVAMLRLNCDILLPSLKPTQGSKGIKRFFKKK